MRLKFFHLLSIITCLIFIMFTYFGTHDLHDDHIHIKYTHITLYVDTSIDDYGFNKIKQAASEWVNTTHHLVEYTVARLPANNINVQESVFISSVSANFPDIMWRDRRGGSTLGLYLGHTPLRTILLVTERLDEETYKATVMHELGHSLGLSHTANINDIGTLMYPFIDLGSDTITNKDLEQFCNLHQCNVKDLTLGKQK